MEYSRTKHLRIGKWFHYQRSKGFGSWRNDLFIKIGRLWVMIGWWPVPGRKVRWATIEFHKKVV